MIAKKKKLTASVWFATKKLDAEKALCLLFCVNLCIHLVMVHLAMLDKM